MIWRTNRFEVGHVGGASRLLCSCLLVLAFAAAALAQNQRDATNAPPSVEKQFELLCHRLDQLEKAVDDVLWYHKVGDVANIDKVYHVGPPPDSQCTLTAPGPLRSSISPLTA